MAKIFHVGIDLGTSQTSITTSTGKRLSATTCIGYAKDIIAKKRFGKDFLLGDEALQHRLALDMVWPLADGVICDDARALEATRQILQHVITASLLEKKDGDKIYAAIGVPARASIKSKKTIIKAAQGIVDKLIVISEPFAVAYSIDRLDECLIVDIGAGTTDLCRMHGVMPADEDQCTLTFAGDFLDDILTKEILKAYPDVQLTPKIIRNIKEKFGYLADVTDPVLVTLRQQGIPAEFDITDILHHCCTQLATPISQAIQEMVASFDPDFQEKLRHNIIIAGGGSRLKGIDLAVLKSLDAYGGGEVTCVRDAEYCGSIGALKMCTEMPDEYWEKL